MSGYSLKTINGNSIIKKTDGQNIRISFFNGEGIPEDVNVSNVYVAAFTLVCLHHGHVTITDERGRTIHCVAPGLMVLERNQLINITMQEVDGHLSFDVLDIPHELLTIAHELLIEKLQTEHQPGEHPFRIVYSNDFAARKEVFDLLRFTLSQEKKASSKMRKKKI
ncbi:cofS [Escherichia coli DEC13C]|nr:hypothetical protein [Escherichia coli]EHX59953.1 cofS [Escherichia coli DEC13C]